MEIVLLVTKQEVESLTGLNAADDKYYKPAAAMAHIEQLTSIIGKPLYDAAAADISVFSSDLLFSVKMYLIFQTAANFCQIASNKVSNFGVGETTDAFMQASERREIRTQSFYQGRADVYCRAIQQYILQHWADYSAYISEAQAEGMRVNLHSYANGGLWLGGVRYYKR